MVRGKVALVATLIIFRNDMKMETRGFTILTLIFKAKLDHPFEHGFGHGNAMSDNAENCERTI